MNIFSTSIRVLAAGFALALSASRASADDLALYTFGSNSDSFATSDTNTNSVASSLTAVVSNGVSGFSVFMPITNVGLAQAAPRTYYIDSSATPDNSNSANDYLQFTLTINEGFSGSLTSISFDHAATTGTFNSNWEVRYSLDGFATAGITLGTSTKAGTTGHDYIRFSQAITAPALESIGANATVTFRIYAYDNTSGAPINRIDNITLEGVVAAIPEPSTYAVAFGLAAVGLAATRRRARVG